MLRSRLTTRGQATLGVGVRAGAGGAAIAMTIVNATKPAAAERPVFVARFRALPDVDAIHSLRVMLKSALRLHGLQCLSLEEEPNHATQTTQNSDDT
jgi:hypothetical protein